VAEVAGRSQARQARGRRAETVEQSYTVEVGGRRFDVRVIGRRRRRAARRGVNGAAPAAVASPAGRSARAAGRRADTLESPLQGNMWKVLVEQGATVEEGQLICIIEAMKMENEITAHKAGSIAELRRLGGRADRRRRHDRRHPLGDGAS
jgi:acetyl-CoA/propionyl-CoA carboxylase biotin carboxyl carrier protein